MRQLIKENDALRRLYYRMHRARSQSNEAEILDRLAVNCPKTFVEFGFHPAQFNCASLSRNSEWSGLLIDGDVRQVSDARVLLPKRLTIVREFLTRDNLSFIKTAFPKIGVLSIDVDGNDYWLLEGLIEIGPSVICVEYNSTMEARSISVPYDDGFDRFKKHPSGLYHGASIVALAKLCASRGYGLAAVSDKTCNAFFTQDGTLDPKTAWKPGWFREKFSGLPHDQQWDEIKHLPFVVI